MTLVGESEAALRLARVLLDRDLPGILSGFHPPEGSLVLLGRRVVWGFGIDYLPFSIACGRRLVAVLPAPTGRERAWDDPMAIGRARACVAELDALTRAASEALS